MKIYLYILICIAAISCKKKAEFYIDGVPFYTQARCVSHHTEIKHEYHYGYSYRGKYEWHFGPRVVNVCDQVKVDTVRIK